MSSPLPEAVGFLVAQTLRWCQWGCHILSVRSLAGSLGTAACCPALGLVLPEEPHGHELERGAHQLGALELWGAEEVPSREMCLEDSRCAGMGCCGHNRKEQSWPKQEQHGVAVAWESPSSASLLISLLAA